MEGQEAGDVDSSAGVAPVTGTAGHTGDDGHNLALGSGGQAATAPAAAMPQVAVGQGRGRCRVLAPTTPGIGKRMKTTNLKNYFTKLSASSSGSRPSTNESRNTTGSIAAEVVQNNVAPSTPSSANGIETAAADIAQVEIETTNAHPQTQPQAEHEDIGTNLIEQFDPHEPEHEKFGHEIFTKKGYNDWKHAYRELPGHIGGVSSCHNRARLCAEDFKKQRASIPAKIDANSKSSEILYEVRLTVALDVTNFLISQGHAFHGHDESASSLNKGNFLEMIDWYKKKDEDIQKDLTRSYAEEITEVIKEEIGDSLFSVLIDESRDISVTEQMAILVRFVNKKRRGLKHVEDTTSSALKKALTEIFAAHGLPLARLRGQGYDGASNMRGEFNGLQKQIRDENPYAFYVHWFAHQLQLVIVSVASCCSSFDDFFNYVGLIVERKDKLVTKHRETILNKIESGEIFTGRGLHQTTSLARPGDTRWGSHFTTLIRIESMWDSVVNVLSMIHEDECNPGRAGGLVRKMESFSFVLNMKLMLKVFRITNDLSLLLQRKDQNIVQAMSLLVDVKTRLVNLRNEGWEPLLEEVKSFCVAKNIPIPNMDEAIQRWGRSRLQGDLITQGHHYRVDTFFAALDAILTEMDHRFNEVSSELFVCFACLDPRNNFFKFVVDKIARLTEIYDEDFSFVDRSNIRDQLGNYIIHVRRMDAFAACHDLRSLAVKMVDLERDRAFPLVYRLIELALILHVATASVERAFSAMHFIKTDLRNKIICFVLFLEATCMADRICFVLFLANDYLRKLAWRIDKGYTRASKKSPTKLLRDHHSRNKVKH
ncbi:hypothetical protein U9M48_015903 [Paspalum notatum var. saurae]|uniref:DUF4371 domain-containing protein n=1 Tax=Paspalum notatum var. saurae TaxID=547442 RepID=A0AAQ3WLY5_PASNO